MRDIDKDKPLSDDDRQWLTDWGRFAQIEEHDRLHPPKGAQAGDDDSGEPEEPVDPLKGEEPTYTDLSATEPAAVPENWTQETDEEPYEDWGKDDLADEAAERGLSKSGNKGDLVQRLRDADNDPASVNA